MTKLHALVVGINIYKAERLKNYPLSGCVNDVARMSTVLQKMFAEQLQLLTLTETQATRSGIINAFRTQLIEPARIWAQSGRPSPEPAFLFHFSGHGSLNRDVTQTKPSGFDETIVPYDSRQADIFDIRDWELGALIDELGQYTSCITIVLDCCHAGSGTRSTGRMCEPDLRTPPARNLPKPQAAQSSGMRSTQETKMADYVLLAACHAKQIAQEYRDNTSGQTVAYGAMTYALTETLAELKSRDVTCRELYEMTRNKVRTWYPEQIPQCEGDRDRLLFSSERPGKDFPFMVTRVDNDNYVIDGGRIHGLSKGHEFDVYPSTARVLKTSGNAVARLKIEQADPVTSRCVIISGATSITAGARLAPVSSIRTNLESAIADEQRAALEIRNTEPSNLTGKITIAAYRAKPVAPGTLTGAGSPGSGTATSAAATDFELLSPDVRGDLRIVSGTSVCFFVTNNSAQPLYCQILSFGYDGSISRIWPKLTGEQLAVEPGRTLRTSRFKLMFAPTDKTTNTAKEYIKVFASAVQFDVDMLCTGNRSEGESLNITDDWTTAELGYELIRSN
jgi:hypothetical protein